MKHALLIYSLLFTWSMSVQGQAPVTSPPVLTLERAWQLAEQNDAGLKAVLSAVTAAQGLVEDTQGLFWNNPELSLERDRRTTPQPGLAPSVTQEWTAGLSQPFEMGGQQGYRRAMASQELAAARHRADEVRRQLRAEVERRFVRVLGLQLRVVNEREALKLSEELARLAAKRVAAGEDSRLDGNMATVEAGRARNQLALLGDQALTARVELAELLQWPADSLPEVAGELAVRGDQQTLEQLLVLAAERSQLKALRAREEAARSKVDLEKAARYPDLTVGLRMAREGPAELREKVIGFSVSIPLPLFRRNAGGVAQAGAELTNAQVDRQAAERAAQAAVRSLWQRRLDLRARVQTLRDTVIPALDENQRLSQRALREGEIGMAQLMLINRQLVESRREFLDALGELRLVQVDLEQSAGWMPEPAKP